MYVASVTHVNTVADSTNDYTAVTDFLLPIMFLLYIFPIMPLLPVLFMIFMVYLMFLNYPFASFSYHLQYFSLMLFRYSVSDLSEVFVVAFYGITNFNEFTYFNVFDYFLLFCFYWFWFAITRLIYL